MLLQPRALSDDRHVLVTCLFLCSSSRLARDVWEKQGCILTVSAGFGESLYACVYPRVFGH